MIKVKSISHEETLPIRHVVLWPSKPIDYVRVKNDEAGYHYGVYVEEKLVSVISVFITDNEAQFRKFATLVEEQGKGYGSKLFQHMLKELEEMDIKRVWCNARSNANGFYKHYGFKNAADTVFYRGEISYTIMELYLNN